MKIQILSLPRTGSAYLRKMLSFQMYNYNNFYTISEPFNHSKNNIKGYEDKNAIIKNIINSDHVLVKNHIHEIFNINKLFLNQYCTVNWFTICLLRKNVFEMTLSRSIALQMNKWDNQNYKNLTIKIDNNFFEKCLKDSIEWIRLVKQNPFNFNYNKIIYYEDLKFNSLEDLKKLDISLQHTKFYSSKKLYSKKNLVSNYNELFNISINFLESISDLEFKGVVLKCL